jgi:alpha-amylase
MEECFERCYGPFLELMSSHPRIPFSYHLSGCLLEWIAENRPRHLDLLAEMVGRGQVELVGGACYEPIVSAIPRRDAIAQIELHRTLLRRLLGAEPRGMWLPERVWEPSLPSLLRRAGVEFTLLDDTHFLAAGLRREELHGYFLAEDQGALLPLFPVLESLRYTIPFEEPADTIAVLRKIAEETPGTVIAYGDDVEKFGVWPDTFRHCFEEGWLERFLTTIEENLPWIRLVGLGEAVDELPPRGHVYPPETSYAEMNEWTLPAHATARYAAVRQLVKDDPELAAALPFVRGPSWRSFRVKYPEIRRLYGRALDVSRRMAALPDEPAADEAKQELYRGQCNCPYWHGIFGGHYLPHLREAVWRHLLAAERLADELTPLGAGAASTRLDRTDVDLDGREELYVRNEHVGIVVDPRGGRVIEYDLRSWGLNLFSVLGRRTEAYHQALRDLPDEAAGGEFKSIHDLKQAKDPDLAAALHYDPYEHLGFTDLLLDRTPAPGDFVAGRITDRHALHTRPWGVAVTETGGGHRIELSSPAGGVPLAVTKAFRLDGPCLTVDYAVANASGAPWKGVFAVEVPFALQTGSSPNRVWRDLAGCTLGPLGLEIENQRGGISVCDWDHDLGVTLGAETGTVLTYAVRTVSQSEAGFEGVFQQAVAVVLYELALEDGESRTWTLRLTSARAPARRTADLVSGPASRYDAAG